MAEPPSLGDFFAKKKKKPIKGSNLNAATAAAAPGEATKPKAKSSEEQGWAYEEVAAPTMKVEIAGKLQREEAKQEEEQVQAPAWGTVKPAKADSTQLSDKKYPTLAKSIQSSNIQLDGGEAKVNISVSKNAYEALGDQEDEDGSKRPSQIKPAMVQKKKGEFEKTAIQREVDKYAKPKGKSADDEEAGDVDEAPKPEAVEEKKKEKKVKKDEEKKDEAETKDLEEDLKIQPNLQAAKAKYKRRKKLPKQELPAEELKEEKENKPLAANKKKWALMEEEEDYKPKLKVLEED